MNLLPLYLKKEPSREHAGRFDVVAYRDAKCETVAARWPWYYSSKPRRNARRVTFNCYRWRAEWVTP